MMVSKLGTVTLLDVIRRGLGYSVVGLACDVLAALEDLELDLGRGASQAVVFH